MRNKKRKGAELSEAPIHDSDGLLDALESSRRLAPEPAALNKLLATLDRAAMDDIETLARFHDALLFLCAYPPSPRILKRAESILERFSRRVARLKRSEDFNPLLDPEISGIAGTAVKMVLSYEMARWLMRRHPKDASIDWDEEPDPERLASVLPLLVPLLEEEASVDANVPYLTWLRAAQTKDGGLSWLMEHFERLPLSASYRATLYGSLGLWIRWELTDANATRTGMRRPSGTTFYQQTAPIGRREVSIERELASRRVPVRRLSSTEGEAVLDMARAALAIRYREFYCFNHGDPATVLSADCGRGLQILLIGIRPEMRLPLRAGFAHFILRNGVPIGYGDAFGLCERMEVSFNIFQAFRDGESAWCLARLLKLYNQQFGTTSFSMDPYQIGFENDEAIESGAFWFYRKLGFRCTDPDIERIARREEQKVATSPGYRTPPRLLRRMARGSLLWELPAAGSPRTAEWDRFHVRNIGLRVGKRFGPEGPNTEELQESVIGPVAAALGTDLRSLSRAQRRALARLSPVLAIISLNRWSADERDGIGQIVRAKAGRTEARYLALLSRHTRLRRALISLGTDTLRES